MADARVKNWQLWQTHLLSCPLVVALSLRPHPWLNSDGTRDFQRLCILVFLGRKLSDNEMAKYDLPEMIEDYPVQYIHPSMLPQGKPHAIAGDSGSLAFLDDGTPIGLMWAGIGGLVMICKAENIEQLLGVCFEPPAGWEALSTQYEPSMIPKNPRDRFDVLVGGISIGHGYVTAGTLGCFVWDSKTGEILGLTCAHVAAPLGAKMGDPIYQPGPLDIRTRFNREPNEHDICGYLLRWQEISTHKVNLIDAAVFSLTRPAWPDYVLGLGRRQLRRPC